MNIDLEKMVALATEEGDDEDDDRVRLKVLLELKEAFVEYVRINPEDKEAHAAIRVTLKEIDNEVETIQPPEGEKPVHFQESNKDSQVSDIRKNSGKVTMTAKESADEPSPRQPTPTQGTPDEEDEDESRYKILMLAKAELLRRLEEEANDAESRSKTLFALEEIGKAEQVYSIMTEIVQTGYDDSDDEIQEEHSIHETPKEIFTTLLEGTHRVPSQSIFPACKVEPDADDSNEDEETLSDLELAKFGALRLWEYSQILKANQENSHLETETALSVEIGAKTEDDRIQGRDSISLEVLGVRQSTQDEKEDFARHMPQQEVDQSGEPTPDSTHYEEKSGREPLIEGRVFDVGKTITPMPPHLKNQKISMTPDYGLSNSKEVPETDFRKRKAPPWERQILKDPKESPDTNNREAGEDRGRISNPPHKLREDVNSHCSQVWKIRNSSGNQRHLIESSGITVLTSQNKQLKPGWDPPEISTH